MTNAICHVQSVRVHVYRLRLWVFLRVDDVLDIQQHAFEALVQFFAVSGLGGFALHVLLLANKQ